MDNPLIPPLPILSLQPGDYVCHPRLGTGHVLRQREDGSVVVWFDGKAKPDILFPFQLAGVDPGSVSSQLAPSQGSGQK